VSTKKIVKSKPSVSGRAAMVPWRWEAGFAPLALFLSLVALSWTVYTYFWEEEDKKTQREIQEIDRLFDPTFATSLSEILQHAYSFLEQSETAGLTGRARFERFGAISPPIRQ